jgi:hemerythrin
MRIVRHIPDRIYNAIPYGYMVGGILIAAILANPLALVSGLALLTAGVLIWSTRRTYRNANRMRVARPPRGPASRPGSHDSALAMPIWNAEYECGIGMIDAQHRRLFELCANMRKAIIAHNSKLDIELHLDELIQDVAKHFTSEENLLSDRNLALPPEHKKIHKELLASCQDLAHRFHNDEVKVADLFNFLVREVLTGHILAEDIRTFAGKP